MANLATVSVTGGPDDYGRQPFAATLNGRTQELHGYPCDHIALLQSEGHDVLVNGEVRVLPSGVYGYPRPAETPNGTIYPARHPRGHQSAGASQEAIGEPNLADSTRAITARLDRLQHSPQPEPPSIGH